MQQSALNSQNANPFSLFKKFVIDFVIGGTSLAFTKPISTPIQMSKLYKLSPNAFWMTLRLQGVTWLWSGTKNSIIRMSPYYAISFSVKDLLKRLYITGVGRDSSYSEYFMRSHLCGGIAGCFSYLFMYPVDAARNKMMMDLKNIKREFNGLADCLRKTYQKSGLQELYRGFGVSLLAVFVYRAFYLGGYDSSKVAIWGSEQDASQASFWSRFALALVVASSAGVISYPLDTIRRRLMMSYAESNSILYHTTFAQEGLKGFYKGNVAANFSRRMVGVSLPLVIYDELQKRLVAPYFD